MTTCTQLSDRMPDVAHGTSRWTETEEHHLAACADCRAEWELVTAASRLGAALRSPADPALVSTVLLQRLARERQRTRLRAALWTAAGLAAAAAVILAVWTGARTGPRPGGAQGGAVPRVATAPVAPARPEGTVTPGDSAPQATRAPALATAPTGAQRAELPLPELDDLPAEALDSMLQVLDEPGARADAYELPALADPGDRELERALTGLEG
jgi:predicted anti-sigma-YlaC factor YlaD